MRPIAVFLEAPRCSRIAASGDSEDCCHEPQGRLHHGQRGAVAVEFALTVTFWVFMTVAVIDLGRFMYLWAASYEATRLAARDAVVCSNTDADVRRNVKALLPLLTDANIQISYAVSRCSGDYSVCPPTTVRIQGVSIQPMVPFLPTLSLPAAETSLYPETRHEAGDPTCS